jgi:hypothetical protein
MQPITFGELFDACGAGGYVRLQGQDHNGLLEKPQFHSFFLFCRRFSGLPV